MRGGESQRKRQREIAAGSAAQSAAGGGTDGTDMDVNMR